MIDWIAVTGSLAGTLFNAKKSIICWPVWIVSNTCWIIYGLRTGQPSLVVMDLIFCACNLWGWRCWNHEDVERAKQDYARLSNERAATTGGLSDAVQAPE